MKTTKAKKDAKEGLVKCAAKSALVGIIVTAALLFAVSWLTVAGMLPGDMSDEYIICAVIIGSAISGFICAKKMGGGVIIAGLTAAAFYLVVVLIGTIFTAKPAEEGILTLKICIAALAGGCFGGTLRLYRRTKKSRFRK